MATTKALELGQFGTDLTVDDSTGAVTIANSIASTGIDDNATTTKLTISDTAISATTANFRLTGGYNFEWGNGFSNGDPAIWANTSQKKIRIGPSGNTDGEILLVATYGVEVSGDIQTTGTLKGPSLFYIDPSTYETDSDGSSAGTAAGTVRIRGDLIVDGATTTINSTTLTVADLKIVVAEGAAIDTNGSSAAADGAGLYVVSDTSPVASFSYNDLYDSWASSNELRFPNNNGVFWDIAAGGSSIGLKGDTSDNITFRTAGSWDRLVVASTGNVGVATNDPIQKLDVKGSISLSNTGTASRFIGFYSNVVDSSTNDLSAFIEKSGNNFTIYNGDSGDLQISNSGATTIRINNSNKVGIGPNVNASAILHVKNDSGTTTAIIERAVGNNAANLNEFSSFYSLSIKNRSDGSYLNFGGNSSRTDIQATDGAGSASSKAIHLNPFGGNVGIGTGATAPAAKFNVTGSASGNWISIIENTHNSNGNGLKVLAGDDADTVSFRVSTYNNSTLFDVRSDGDVTATGAYNTDHVRHSIQPSLNLDFANTKQLDSRINFLRDSIATYFDQDGVMRYAQVNEPRFDHDPITGESLGLLIEEDKQNYVVASPGFFGWTDLNTQREHNTTETLAPDGTFSATKVRCTASTGSHRIAKYVGSLGAGQVTFSVYAKASSTSSVILLRESNITGVQGAGAISNGEHVGNGWYRHSIEYTDNGSSNYYPSVYVDTTSTGNVTNDGTEYVYLWGAQVEASEHRSSLIPSLKSAVFASRSSAATYHDASGNLRHAPRDTLRHGHHYNGRKWIPTGPLFEESAVNEVGKTTYMFGVGYNNGNYNIEAYDLTTEVTAPDGSYNASKVISTSTSTFNYTSHYSLSAAFSNGTVQVNSVYAKQGTVRYLWMSMPSTSEPNATFDLQDGVVTRQTSGIFEAGMVDVGNGWYRCYIMGVVAGSPATSAITFSLESDGTGSRTAPEGDYLYLWGKQIEENKLTSHIPNDNSTSQVVRSADVVTLSGGWRMNDIVEMWDVGHLIGQDVGTVYTHWQTLEPDDGFGGVFEIWDSGTNGIDQRFSQYYLTNNYSISYGAHSQGVYRKTALAYDSSSDLDSQTAVNGALQGVNIVHTWNMDLTRIRIGSLDLNAAYQLNGHIKEFRLYKDRMVNAELIALTEND